MDIIISEAAPAAQQLQIGFKHKTKSSFGGQTRDTLSEYITNLSEVLHGVPASNIWNYDEYNLTDDQVKRRLSPREGANTQRVFATAAKPASQL